MTPSMPVVVYGVLSGCASLAAVSMFVASSIFDIRMIKRFRPLKHQPSTNKFRRRPHVSVILIAHNGDEAALELSLKSLRQNKYRKCEVIVISNGAKLTKSDKKIRVIQKRQVVSESVAMASAKRVAKGELLAALRPGYQLEFQTIQQAVQYFLVDESINGLAALGYRLTQKYSISNQVAQVGAALHRRYIKARAIQHKAVPALQRAPFRMYRRASVGNKTIPSLLFAVDLSITQMTKTPRLNLSVLQRLLTWLGWVVVASSQLYLGYLALMVHVTPPLQITIVATLLLALVTLFSDEQLGLRQKLRSMTLMPFWYVAGCLWVLKNVLKPLAIIFRIRIRLSLAP